MTQEVAVMVDTRDALYVGDAAQQIENPQYVNSWQVKENNEVSNLQQPNP